MEERKWEELNKDLLVEILVKVGTESLLQYNIPFVCKSWYNASLVPKCWETIIFPDFNDSDEMVKSVVDRSQGTATHIEFQSDCPKQVLVYISEKCPLLKTLYVWHFNEINYNYVLTIDLICKWKKLEFLHIMGTMNLTEILESISIHCKNFVGLSISSYLCYHREPASAAIVRFIPKIKYLKMKRTSLERMDLMMILKGRRELEFLDVSNCHGFDATRDSEILELALHIPSFKCDGCFGPDHDYYDEILDLALHIPSFKCRS